MAEKMVPRIKIDSREQRPYKFENSVVGSLTIGDYSIENLENCVAVERKTLDDLVSCLSKDRDRFECELHKGRALDYFCLVVEGSLSDLAKSNYRSQMTCKSAIQSLITFSIRHKLPVWFCETREYAERVTESLLLKYAREIEKSWRKLEKGAPSGLER